MVEQVGVDVHATLCNISDESDVRNMYNRVEKELDRLDIVINNAGVTNPRGLIPLVDHTSEEYENIMAVNVKGNFYSCREAVKRMDEKGIIINLSSHGGLWGFSGESIYNASKFAIIGLSETLAKEFKGKVYTAIPAGTDTILFRTHHPHADYSKLDHPEDTGKDIIALCKYDIFNSGSTVFTKKLHQLSSWRIHIRKYLNRLQKSLTRLLLIIQEI